MSKKAGYKKYIYKKTETNKNVRIIKEKNAELEVLVKEYYKLNKKYKQMEEDLKSIKDRIKNIMDVGSKSSRYKFGYYQVDVQNCIGTYCTLSILKDKYPEAYDATTYISEHCRLIVQNKREAGKKND